MKREPMTTIAEATRQLELGMARQIRASCVDQILQDIAGNPNKNRLRAMSELYFKTGQQLEEQNIPVSDHLTNFTIGTLYAENFGYRRDYSPDPHEKDFQSLAEEMAIDPNSWQFRYVNETQIRLMQQSWRKRKTPHYPSYQPDAKGPEETRKFYLEELRDLGFKDAALENAFLCAGGMDGLVRVARTLYSANLDHKPNPGDHALKILRRYIPDQYEDQMRLAVIAQTQEQDVKEKVRMAFPYPGFGMAAIAASKEGPTIVPIQTKEEDEFFPTAEVLSKMISGQGFDVLMLTPLNNPTSLACDPSKLRLLLETSLEKQPNVKFVFDMAYINTVDIDVAKAIVKAIYDSGAADHSVFVFSRSKEFAMPAFRSGLIFSTDQDITKALADDTLRSYASFPFDVAFHDAALHQYYEEHHEIRQKYIELLRKRQSTLLETLAKINHKLAAKGQAVIFEEKYLNSIQIPETTQVPLYLWVKLNDNKTAWDLARDYGIVAVPGDAMGGGKDWVRFSVGTLSCSDIMAIANNV